MAKISRFAICDSVSATGKRITLTKPLSADSSDDTVYLSEALNINSTQLDKCDYVAIAVPNADNSAHEVMACLKANYDNSAKTMSSVIRGVIGYGSTISSDSNLIASHNAGAIISVPVLVQDHVARQEVFDGETATGANALRVGDETDSDIYYYFQNADGNKPGLRYSASGNQVEFSDDGSSWTALGQSGNHGTTANIKDHTDVASAVSDSMAQGDVLFANSTPAIDRLPAGTAGKVLTTQGAGADPTWETVDSLVGANLSEADTFFGSTDITAAEAEELTDGSVTTLHSHAIAGLQVIASDTEIASADTERSSTSTSYIKVKEIEVDFGGTYRVAYDLKLDVGGTGAVGYGKIYKNGSPFGTESTDNNSATYATKSEDLVFSAGDLIQLYYKASGETVYVQNFKIKGTVVSTTTVNTD